jgi:hypothetical protein
MGFAGFLYMDLWHCWWFDPLIFGDVTVGTHLEGGYTLETMINVYFMPI